MCIRDSSGGERGRLQLARGLRLPSNFLVLDEPTNDLDLETLDLLQELVADYKGTVVVVSHDRDFLDRTVTRTIGFEGNAKWQSYAGGYTDMINQRGHGVQQRKKAEKDAKAKPKEAVQIAAPQKGKLSYKHKFRLEQLPAEMARYEDDMKAIEAVLADPNLFSSNPDKFIKAIADLDAVKTKLEACEEEWLELEMLKEESA